MGGRYLHVALTLCFVGCGERAGLLLYASLFLLITYRDSKDFLLHISEVNEKTQADVIFGRENATCSISLIFMGLLVLKRGAL